jgi:hypothetical protein
MSYLLQRKLFARAGMLFNFGTLIDLRIKIPSQNMREKPTNTPIIHSVY